MSTRHLVRRASMAAGALALVVGGPLVASAAAGDGHGDGHHGKGFRVAFDRVVDPALAPATPLGPPLCVPGSATQCVLAVQPTGGIVSGDLVGKQVGMSLFAPLVPGGPGGGAAIQMITLTGSPCGTGVVTFMGFAAGNGTSVNEGRWAIPAGTGTGAVANMSGEGVGTISNDLKTAHYEGKVYCNNS